MGTTPTKERLIDPALVRALLQEQHPDLAGMPLRELAEGWDNVVFRLGDDLSVRLPRRSASAPLILNEQRCLPLLAATLPLPVPVPLRIGRPSAALAYEWPWSVGPWLQGVPWEVAPPTDRALAADCLGRFIAALHRPAPPDAPINPYRGIPLPARTDRLFAALDSLDALGRPVDRAAVLTRWDELVQTPAWAGPAMWLHGDLHPLNLLVAADRLSAVIDFGDVCAGDPASDLAVAWMLFDRAQRRCFRAAAAVDDDTWRRGQGWALALALAFSAGDSRIVAIGQRTLVGVLADDV